MHTNDKNNASVKYFIGIGKKVISLPRALAFYCRYAIDSVTSSYFYRYQYVLNVCHQRLKVDLKTKMPIYGSSLYPVMIFYNL